MSTPQSEKDARPDCAARRISLDNAMGSSEIWRTSKHEPNNDGAICKTTRVLGGVGFLGGVLQEPVGSAHRKPNSDGIFGFLMGRRVTASLVFS